MPKKVVPNARKHNASNSTSHRLNANKEGSKPAGDHAKRHAGSKNLTQCKQNSSDDEDPYHQKLIRTSDVFPDTEFVIATREQLDKCQSFLTNLCKKGEAAVRAEYRKLFTSLMQSDRTDLRTRADSGDDSAAKIWGEFSLSTLKLLYLRYQLFGKPIRCGNYKRGSSYFDKDYVDPYVLTESDMRELGRVTFAPSDGAAIEGLTLESEMLGDKVGVIIDMSQWVRKGATHNVTVRCMRKAVAMQKKYAGTKADMVRSYQIVLSEIQDADQEQLMAQAEAGISKDSLAKYFAFCDRCFQLVALWHIIYNKPIPIASKDRGVPSSQLSPEMLEKWKEERWDHSAQDTSDLSDEPVIPPTYRNYVIGVTP